MELALCICGTLGKGALRMYPPFWVPTYPFRVLGRFARDMEVPRGEFSHVNNTALPRYDAPQGGVYFDNWQGFPSRGATEKNTHSVHLFHKSKNISFPLLMIVVF